MRRRLLEAGWLLTAWPALASAQTPGATKPAAEQSVDWKPISAAAPQPTAPAALLAPVRPGAFEKAPALLPPPASPAPFSAAKGQPEGWSAEQGPRPDEKNRRQSPFKPVGGQNELPPPRPAPAAAPNGPLLELVEFDAIPLSEAMRLLSQVSGERIVPSDKAGKKIVSLYLRDVTAQTAIAAMTQSIGVIHRTDPNTGVIQIFTAEENQRDLRDFREDRTEVFTLLYPNALNVATAIGSIYGTRVRMSNGFNLLFLPQFELQSRFSRFDLINRRSLGLGVNNQSSGSGGGVGGGIGGYGGGGGGGGIGAAGFGGGGMMGGMGGMGGMMGGMGGMGGMMGGMGGYGGGYGGNNLFGQQYGALQGPAPEKRLEKLSPEDIQTLEQLGYDPEHPPETAEAYRLLQRIRESANIYVNVIQANNQLVIRTSDRQTMEQLRNLIARLDVPTPVVLLEVKVLSLNLQDDFTSVFDYEFNAGSLAGGFTTGDILPPLSAALTPAARSATSIAAPSAGTPGTPQDFMFQVVSANFRMRIQMLETKNRVTELATPLLMTANNEVSQIFSGQQVPITVGFNPAQTAAAVGAAVVATGTPITTYQNIGTSLLITPNINADRTVTLRILQENSSVVTNGANIPVPNTNGTGVTQVAVDTVQRQSFSGTVVAHDGLTIAVGGLIDEGVTDNRSMVPLLGQIPGLGFFFRRQATTRFKRELVILIRPYVLSTPCEARDASHALVDRLSIHPSGSEGTELHSFTPIEVIRPNPPQNRLQQVLRVHTITPKDY